MPGCRDGQFPADADLPSDVVRHAFWRQSAAENLLGMIDDLLDFSKIEAGKLELDMADFSVRSVLDGAVRALAVRANKKGLAMASQVQPDVPDALVGDAGRLRQVLLNLIGNAVKFTKRGEVAVGVEVVGDAATEGGIRLRFAVRDTGIGIPKDKHDRIFRAFEQEDSSTTRRFGGTGLGLTIAARLVALMGGTITVDSEPERGSTFAFTAQFGRQAHPTHAVADQGPARRAATAPTPATAPLYVLVAEDNEFNTRHLERLLTRQGHRVRLASNGRQALALAAEAAFDLLLLDVHMPEVDGFQVVRTIRERERTTGGRLPVIALTARSRKEDRERCLAAGMDDFLSKPIRAAELFSAVKAAVSTQNALQSGSNDVANRTTLIDGGVVLAACGGDGEGLRDLCQDYRAYAPGLVAEMSDALRDQSAPALREVAHKLCGLLSTFSSVAGDLASELEDIAARGELDECGPLVMRLEKMAMELSRQVERLTLESLRPGAGSTVDPPRTSVL